VCDCPYRITKLITLTPHYSSGRRAHWRSV